MSESTSVPQEDQIPETMSAVICHGPENYELETVRVPSPGPGEALIKVEAVGICASDLKCYHGATKFWGDDSVDWSIISDDKELNVLGAHLGPNCWPAAIRMIESGVLPMDKICTHQLPLAEFQKGLDLVSSGTESVKVSLIP
jgi:threonine dehydrogenase-like Zn-dependent dehydrogenase